MYGRGLYFTGSGDYHISVQNLLLNSIFSLQAWILRQGTGSNESLFSKNRDVAASAFNFHIYIDASDELAITLVNSEDDSECKKASTGADISATDTW